MGRTILRSANTSEVTDISESFANFASYTGINEDKSFVGTDQNSFEESNNMYVDVNGQLSTRPPVEKHTINKLDGYNVIDIFKVNGITFYKIYGTTAITVYCDDEGNTEDGKYTFYITKAQTFDVTFTIYIEYTDDYTHVITGTIPAGETSVDIELFDIRSWKLQSYVFKLTSNYITWQYNDEWITVVVDEDTNVFYVSSYYIFTNGETIFGYKYSYDESKWVEYTLDNLIYIPEYEIVSSTGTTTNTGALNIFTSAYKKVYNITRASSIDTSDLVGNTIKVIVDNLEFEITWTENTQYTLVTNIGTVSVEVTHIEAGFVSTANPIYIAYCDYWKLSDGHQGCYYSTDGNLWVQINFPEDSEVYSACLSEQSYTLWLQYSKFDYCSLDNTDDDYYDCILYYFTLPTSVINFTFSYSTIQYKVNTYGFCCGQGNNVTSTTEINSFVFDTSFAPMIHSINDGQCILMFRASDAYMSVYYCTSPNTISNMYNSGSMTLGGTSYSNMLCSKIISDVIQGSETNTNDNYNYFVNPTKDTKINDYLILVIVNNYSVTGCYGSLNYPKITTNSCSTNVSTLIRMYPSSLSQNVVNLYTIKTLNSKTYICAYPIILNSNYEPYKTFDVLFASDDTSTIWARYLYGYGIGMNIFVNTDTLNKLNDYSISEDLACMSIQISNNISYFKSDDVDEYTVDFFEKYQDDIQTYYFVFGLNNMSTYNEQFYNNGYNDGDLYYELSLQFTIPSDASTYVMKNDSYVDYSTGNVDYIYSANANTVSSDIYSGMYILTYLITYIDYTLQNETIKQITTEYKSRRFFLYKDTSSSLQLLTNNYYYVNNGIYKLISIEDTEFKVPLAIFSTTINNTSTYNFYYWNYYNYTIYTNDYDTALAYLVITSSGSFTSDDINKVPISFAKELYTTTIGSNNLLYQCTSDPEGTGLLYAREDSKVELPDTITAMIEFSQTIMGVFTNFTAFEYTASSSDGEIYYYLYPTKLVIGNRSGYDLLQSYDGSSIYISTVKGVATLTYEELVQSTEHVFTYLTDNILGAYKEFDTSAIKFCQYLNWLFMYRQDSNICYLYDISNSAWWMWTLPDNITKIYWDTENDVLIVLMSNTLYYFNFDTDDFYDYGTEVINWNFKSQKLHLSAPNNYKHIRRVSIVTTQNTDKMRYKLKFTNYKSWERLQDKYVVEYDIDNLNTLIQKVNFMKCNAFQFEISNDTTWKYPQKFVVSNIAIKYRVTEDIR